MNKTRTAIILGAALLWPASPAAAQSDCANQTKVKVPEAEMQRLACLPDMTTTGTAETDYTDASDWASLSPAGQPKPSGVPGLQVDGYFPDTSTANSTHGWFHDSQFVIRMPDKWNGKLVITGAPGVRKQYAQDVEISDYVIARGYAYASTDKGNGGTSFYNDGEKPGDAGVEWNTRVTQLTIATKAVIEQYYGRAPERTYVTGISQGGYLTRWQLENRPELYDGGVDWEGTFWNVSTPNVFTNLSAALKWYPKYQQTRDRQAHDEMIRAGFAPGSEFLWPDHYTVYWDLTQRTYREEFDPEYDGELKAGIPFCQSGMPSCDADSDYDKRPQMKAALSRIENTGKIGKPMLTLHGTLDSLLPIAINGDPYTQRVRDAGRGALHRYYVIENGNHVDGRYDAFPDRIRPIHPCYLKAFDALDAWVTKGTEPPPSQFVPDDGTAKNVLTDCTLHEGSSVAGPGPLGEVATNAAGERAKSHMRIKAKRRGRSLIASGRVVLPAGVDGCGSGTVAVRVRTAKRTIRTRLMRLRKDCSFRSAIRFKQFPGGRVQVVGRFFGNRLSKGSRAQTRLRNSTKKRT
jgi:pimeloyl-ACP methyl ester carboxylesterase